MSSAICFNLDQSKILSSGNGLSEMVRVSSTDINNVAMKSAEQDQTVRICVLVSLYTFPKNKGLFANNLSFILFDMQ